MNKVLHISVWILSRIICQSECFLSEIVCKIGEHERNHGEFLLLSSPSLIYTLVLITSPLLTFPSSCFLLFPSATAFLAYYWLHILLHKHLVPSINSCFPLHILARTCLQISSSSYFPPGSGLLSHPNYFHFHLSFHLVPAFPCLSPQAPASASPLVCSPCYSLLRWLLKTEPKAKALATNHQMASQDSQCHFGCLHNCTL